MEETNSTTVTVAKRPTFITVLCILSFVGIGLSLILGIKNYFDFSAQAATGPNLMEGLESAGQLGQAMADLMGGLDYTKLATNALIQALLNIPILIGVLMMWKQRKAGFYIYAAFEAIQAILPIIIIGGFTGIWAAIWGIIVAVVFIILYAVNLKHMH